MLLARRRDLRLTSFVFPRNQVSSTALSVLPSLGFNAYRGGEQGWMYDARPGSRNQLHRRVGRFLDQHRAAPARLVDWKELGEDPKLTNVRGSLFLRPCLSTHPRLNALRLRRVASCMERAAASGKILHLWWHPHNFGLNTELNLSGLRYLLTVFTQCRDRFEFQSLSMAAVASAAQIKRRYPKWFPTRPPQAYIPTPEPDMIRIVHVITGLAADGAERMMLNLVTRMDSERFTNEVISLSTLGDLGTKLQAAGIPVRALGLSKNPATFAALLRMRRLFLQSPPDVVQTWMYHADLMGGVIAQWAGLHRVFWGINPSNLGFATNKFLTLAAAKTCALLSGAVPLRIVC